MISNAMSLIHSTYNKYYERCITAIVHDYAITEIHYSFHREQRLQ